MIDRIDIIDKEFIYAYTYADLNMAINGGMWENITEIPIVGNADDTAVANGFSLTEYGWIKYN